MLRSQFFSPSCCGHTSVLYVCVSIPALQVGSPVPFFYTVYMYTWTYNICCLFLTYFTHWWPCLKLRKLCALDHLLTPSQRSQKGCKTQCCLSDRQAAMRHPFSPALVVLPLVLQLTVFFWSIFHYENFLSGTSHYLGSWFLGVSLQAEW